LKSVHVAPNVFQRRLKDENLLEDKQFLWDLVSAIELVSADEQSQPFAPILVTAVGNKYFVVDGHHRLDAYHTAGWRRPVPVEYFEGTLREARAEALERNTKHGLRMTADAKAEAAWELVIENKLKRSEISKHTTVPIRTVARMRAVLKEHRDQVKEWSWIRARRLTWAKDLEFASGDGKHDDAKESWKEKQARRLASYIAKGPKLLQDPEVTARALAMVSGGLPSALVSEWLEQACDAVLECIREGSPADAELVEGAFQRAFFYPAGPAVGDADDALDF
jgi:ParB-like chromosome segregation protein Spo0J